MLPSSDFIVLSSMLGSIIYVDTFLTYYEDKYLLLFFYIFYIGIQAS